MLRLLRVILTMIHR